MFWLRQKLRLSDTDEVRDMSAKRPGQQPWEFVATAMWHAVAFANTLFETAHVFMGVSDDGVVEGFPLGGQSKETVLCQIGEASTAATKTTSPPLDPAAVQMQWQAVRVVAEQGESWDGITRYVYVLRVSAVPGRIGGQLISCAHPMRSVRGVAVYMRQHGHTRVLLPHEVEQIQASREAVLGGPKPPEPIRRPLPAPSAKEPITAPGAAVSTESTRQSVLESAVVSVLAGADHPLTDREVLLMAQGKNPLLERADPKELRAMRSLLTSMCGRQIVTKTSQGKPRYSLNKHPRVC